MTAETVLQKSKNRKAGGLTVEPSPRGSTEDRGSIETRRTAKTTLRHVANGSIGHMELPRKILVLVSSGYLLQYAETGPNNRLPERVLQLGKESAAFACDLIPGKHYVLQISQAVDQQGVLIATSGSIFSKWGLRNAATRRMTANLLLVMHDVAEMDSWMTAIREEIAVLGGGVNARAETNGRPETKDSGDEPGELTKSPSRIHRFQLRSNPSKVSLGGKPSDEPLDTLPPPPRLRDEDERSETGTIDDIEEEAARLTEEPRNSSSKPQSEPDAQSMRSIATSMDQQRLNSLRSSQRISHSTFATTIGSSRTNSLCGSLPSEDVTNRRSESSTESNEPKSPYRTLSSYASAVARRRSAMPLTGKPEQPLPVLNLAAHNLHPSWNTDSDSPVMGRNSPLPKMASPRKLGVAASEPNLRAVADARAKHDSHMPAPPTLFEESERPQSIVGDLPSSLAMASERSPNRRMSSLMQGRSTRKQSPQSFSLPLRINPSTPQNRPPSRQENRGSFNKVEEGNGEPIVHTLTAKIDLTQSAHASRKAPASPQPIARARSPSRTPSGRLSLFPSQLSTPPLQSPALPDPTQQQQQQQPPSSATTTHSQPAPPPPASALKRPTSLQVRSDPAPFLLRGVRMRTSTYGGASPIPTNTTTTTAQPPARSFTAPIRSLKPSRSSAHISARTQSQTQTPAYAHAQPASPTDPFTLPSSSTSSNNPHFPEIPEEGPADADRSTPLPSSSHSPTPHPSSRALSPSPRSLPLPSRALSPSPLRPSSRNGMASVSARKYPLQLKPRASLPELDLGIPVVGLGPPAPPPSAPLPLPPGMGMGVGVGVGSRPGSRVGSRPGSPMAIAMPMVGGNGLGIRV
ncbi:hypothetical protein B0A55_00203 [Friedmanniomyces simplex]|uniref:PH domain-containing protein n=1 Tax=Friedmanniomyces simplex TaxID=329884 RepID=A0A4U0Y870_9PEZI|nr:hypothetical protein B0A55_00203 [Friedmanniomyces simplex]